MSNLTTTHFYPIISLGIDLRNSSPKSKSSMRTIDWSLVPYEEDIQHRETYYQTLHATLGGETRPTLPGEFYTQDLREKLDSNKRWQGVRHWNTQNPVR